MSNRLIKQTEECTYDIAIQFLLYVGVQNELRDLSGLSTAGRSLNDNYGIRLDYRQYLIPHREDR